MLKRIFPVMFEAIEKGYARTAHIQGSFSRALRYHKDILDAILRQDGAEAQRVVQLHIQQTLLEVTESMEGETT